MGDTERCWAEARTSCSTLSQGVTSVYSEDITLNLMAQLGLEVAQFLLQAGERRENDGLRAQRSTGLHIVVKPLWLPVGIVGSLSILLVDLRVLTLGPLFWFGIHGVPQRVVWVILKGDTSRGVPLGMLLAKALLGIGSQPQLLTLPQLHNEDVILLHIVVGVVVSAPRCYRYDPGVVGDEIAGCDVTSLVFIAPDVQGELYGALRAELITRAVSGILHLIHNVITGEWDETQPVCNEFIMEHRGVGIYLHPVDGYDRDFCDEHSPNGIRHLYWCRGRAGAAPAPPGLSSPALVQPRQVLDSNCSSHQALGNCFSC